MPIEFTLLEGPESENAGQEMKKIRLFGVDIYPSNTNNTAARKTKTPELIDLLSTRDRIREPHNSDGPWKIQMELSSADVSVFWGRLQLPKEFVEVGILPFMDIETVKQLWKPGTMSVEVRVVDDDMRVVYDNLKLTHYSSTDAFVLKGHWNRICRDRGLQMKDKIGLYWDRDGQELHFSVLERAPPAAPMNT